MGITDKIVESILEHVNVEQKDIDKATEILDMISFTKENGKDIILIKIGDNVEIKILK
tara:strand:- start:827 stop:1000 length:174 start_codon:yes stop_codon:yes gene_type:complete